MSTDGLMLDSLAINSTLQMLSTAVHQLRQHRTAPPHWAFESCTDLEHEVRQFLRSIELGKRVLIASGNTITTGGRTLLSHISTIDRGAAAALEISFVRREIAK